MSYAGVIVDKGHYSPGKGLWWSRPVNGYGAPPIVAESTMPSWVGIVVIGGVVLGIGYLIFKGVDARQRRLDRIAEKEGSSGVLKYEAGEALLGLGTAAGYSLLDKPRRNTRRNVRRRRRS